MVTVCKEVKHQSGNKTLILGWLMWIHNIFSATGQLTVGDFILSSIKFRKKCISPSISLTVYYYKASYVQRCPCFCYTFFWWVEVASNFNDPLQIFLRPTKYSVRGVQSLWVSGSRHC